MSDTDTGGDKAAPITINVTSDGVAPWWLRLIPDNKSWLTIASTAVVFYVLWMIKQNPVLLANASFMQFVGTVGTGVFVLIANHFFGGTKAGSDVMSAQNAKLTGTGSGKVDGQP